MWVQRAGCRLPCRASSSVEGKRISDFGELFCAVLMQLTYNRLFLLVQYNRLAFLNLHVLSPRVCSVVEPNSIFSFGPIIFLGAGIYN